MMVLVLERVPQGLRGELTRWLLEPRAGVFVGQVSAMVRDRLWERTCKNLRGGAGMLVYTTDNEQGFAFRLHGEPTREAVQLDGLWLVRIPAENAEPAAVVTADAVESPSASVEST